MTPEEAKKAIQEAQKNAVTQADGDTGLAPTKRHLSHGYQDDLAQAMNATDASVVQEMLTDARNREAFEKKEVVTHREQTWFSLSSFILIILALAIGGYGVWHYTHLTVPAEKVVSVGVFPSIDPIKIDKEPIEALVQEVIASQDLKENTPYLIPLTDPTTGGLITNRALFSYIEAHVDEPFAAQFSSIRLGVMYNGSATSTFIIGSVTDPVSATKEFLIAEPRLLRDFAPALNIDTAEFTASTDTAFTQEYRYNLPYRFYSVTNSADASKTNIFYYGFASNSIVVIATDPSVLKAVSDTLIRQQ
jgi:hypothetical protein